MYPYSPTVPGHACVALFFQAVADPARRQEFLSLLPFFYTEGASPFLEEFLVIHLKTISGWNKTYKHLPYLYRASVCILRLRERQAGVVHLIQTMHAAIPT